MQHSHGPTRATGLVAALVTAALMTGCSVGGSAGSSASSGGSPSKTVVVATHDSWAMSKDVLRQFTARTGYHVTIQQNGDVGQLTNKLVLTKSSPIADLTYGIDNTFASRAVDEKVISGALTPVDTSDVCVNVDDVWFRAHHLAAPRTLDDLLKPRYRGLFVTPGATTSSPGLAFLLATIARYGDRWPSYWTRLMANGTRLTPGWTEAYEVDFTAGGGHGSRPIVLSYASSPPFTIPQGKTRPTTHALLDTCFRQVEYAGVLRGASNPAGAKAFMRFMTQPAFQRALPDNMYVYPVDRQVALPASWARFAKTAPHPFSVPAAEITANRDTWLRRWGDLTSR